MNIEKNLESDVIPRNDLICESHVAFDTEEQLITRAPFTNMD